ncbi:NfeD family protein [Anaeromyxobacter diazotrophicus]|uniref:Serine protease n=1 Tax=Anaeromyxobacter diazotrophicus TaxID=2590199 RepID=A0A7I9VSA6_9BACT|nr:nodulation protein NfeD [Anaeromyxobacter diazotrophicus]GEJ59295.1 serine protease [Anaeromyxobacter diazotrophicus]
MRAAVLALTLAAALAPSGAAPPPGASAAAPPRVLHLSVQDAITSGTAEYVAAGLARAQAEGYDAVAITLDTPGGHLDATRDLVQRMLASPVPVAVWVGPAGARAGSAGVFITLAAQVAGMHPASNIGAAHPVTSGGGDVEQSAGKDMAKKVENDTAAFARSIAKARGRNAEWAEKAVRESVSVTAEEALRLKVVDLVAPTLPALLAAADGRQVEAAGKPVTFRGKGAVLTPLDPTIRQRTLGFLADPNVAALLMLVGTLGIALELYHPGALVPGVVGGVCLFLAFVATRVIPVNAGAVLLLLGGVGLLVAEGYVTTHGIAGAAGAVCVLVGTLLFIDKSSPEYHFDPAAFTLSPLVVWPTPLAMTALLAFVAWKVAASRRTRLVAGFQGLVGEEGEALSEVGPAGGQVFVHGEYWRARAAEVIPQGARVRVASVEGLVATVVPATGRVR